MPAKLNFDKDLKAVQDIMVHTNTSLFISSDLYYKQRSLMVIHSTFFKYTRAVHYRMAIIELYKLVSRSDKHRFNIKLLITNLQKGEYQSNTDVSMETLNEWSETLQTFGDTIAKVSDLRNKYYAHKIDYEEEEVPVISYDLLFDLMKFFTSITDKLLKEQSLLMLEKLNHQYSDFISTMDVFNKRDEIYKEHELMKTNRPLPNF